VPELSAESRELLEGLRDMFTEQHISTGGDDSLLATTHQAIADWIHTLPRGALNSRLVSKQCRKFQRALRAADDPQRLLLKEIPAFGGAPMDVTATLSGVGECKAELESLDTIYCDEVGKLVIRELGGILPGRGLNVLAALETWTDAIPASFHSTISSPDTRNFLRTITTGFTSGAVAAERIAVACTGRTFQHWSDEDLIECRQRFVQHLETIESEVVESTDGCSHSVRSFILRNRIRRLAETLAQEIGTGAASDFLNSLMDHTVNDSEATYGNRRRSTRNTS